MRRAEEFEPGRRPCVSGDRHAGRPFRHPPGGGDEQVGKGSGLVLEASGVTAQGQPGGRGQVLAVGDCRQPEQRQRGNRVAGGFCAVVILLHARHVCFGVRPALPESTVRAVEEPGHHGVGQFQRERQCVGVQGGLIEVQYAGKHERIGAEELHGIPFAAAPAVVHRPTRRIPQPGAEERQVAPGGIQKGAVAQDGVGLGKRSHHQAVPRGQDFVVPRRTGPAGARSQQFVAGRGEEPDVARLQFRVLNAQHIQSRQRIGIAVVDEIPLPGHAEVANGDIAFGRRQDGGHRGQGPAVEDAFPAFAVGVFRRIESAVGIGHVAEDVAQDVPCRVGMSGFAAGLIRLDINTGEQGVVVQHLFEVGYQPFFVG